MSFRRLLLLLLLLLATLPLGAQAPSGPAADDPVVRAMKMELGRSMKQLRLENVQAPYYIEYSVVEVDHFAADAVFGASRHRLRSGARLVRAVVRVGDYKEDSYEGAGQGRVEILPQDDDLLVLRHQLWLATDSAYKQAIEALTAKQAKLKQLEVEHSADDFAKAPALQLIAPLAKLEIDENRWAQSLESASALYRQLAEVQSFECGLRFTATNRYFANSEGTVIRQGSTAYTVEISSSVQAPDGMRLDRGRSFVTSSALELPSGEELQKAAGKVLDELKALRAAPRVEEEYRGPVLFSAGSAGTVFMKLVAPNILGRKPAIGSPARTLGDYAGSYKARVLPDFISVVDDPTATTAQGRRLMGTYAVDDEGVRGQAVTAVDKGELVAYLLGRQPIRDFPASNGHARGGTSPVPGPAVSNLFVRSSQTASNAELKKKLIDLCAQRSLPYCYRVESASRELVPRMLYRVFVNDGHEELVRGAVFAELDTRALRNELIAAGDDYKVNNMTGAAPESVIAPSILLQEVLVRRSTAHKQKLPVYPPPPEGAE